MQGYDRKLPFCAFSNLDYLLAKILSAEQTDERFGRVLKSFGDRFRVLEFPGANPLSEIRDAFDKARGVPGNDESFHQRAIHEQ